MGREQKGIGMMRFAFRVDSSSIIGTGHLMRCLTLANALRDFGFECYFICRDYNCSSSERILDAGYKLHLLPYDEASQERSWLGVSVKQDVLQTLGVLRQNKADWLIVDHYSIDAEWEQQIADGIPVLRLFVIDDLMNRKHVCNLLLDQTFGRTKEDYQPLLPVKTDVLSGTDFALLRSEFCHLRQDIKADGFPDRKVPHIFITLGGGDISQSLQLIGDALENLSKQYEFTVTAIIGNTPDEALKAFRNMGSRVELVTYTDDMAREMKRADFAIGAGGGTSWERCCLGLPCIVLTLADNQVEIANTLAEKKAGLKAGHSVSQIENAVLTLLNDRQLLKTMRENAMALCDGGGVDRVLKELVRHSLEIYNSSLEDARFIYDARYEGDASKYYRNSQVPDFESHLAWMERALASRQRLLITFRLGNEPVAHGRVDKDIVNEGLGEIGFCIGSKWRGRGLGHLILSAATQYFLKNGLHQINAEVHENNKASARIFEQAGYTYVSTDSDGFMGYSIPVECL